MSAPDTDPLAQLERRVAALEQRLGAGDAVAPPPVAAPTAAPARAAGPAFGWGPPPMVRPAPLATSPAMAAPATLPAPTRSRSFADLEEQLSSRLLAWVGGVALVLGAMFFLSLAFSRGWIGPEARVLIGLVAGAAALLAGAWLFERGDRTPAMVLAGVGVATGSLALFAASRLYGFIPVDAALAGFMVLAVGTAAIALRVNSQAVAAFGLVAVTAAPPILGASPTLVTVAFLGAALVGTALISFGRSWPWLALLAFLMSVPQAASWLGGEQTRILAIAGIGAFWTINALAAAGSALAGLGRNVHRAKATLLVGNALFAILAIHSVLPDDPPARSAGLLLLAGLHGALAAPLLLRQPGRHPFGLLAASVAAGTLAIGIAIELGGIAVPIGHTVLATAIAWIAIRFRERVAAAWAAAIGSLAVLHLIAVDYPLVQFGRTRPEGWPFASPEAIVAIVMAAASLITGVVAWRSFRASPSAAPRSPWRLTARLALAAGALGEIAVIAYAADFELRTDLRVVAWAILAGLAFAVAAVIRRDRRAWLAAVSQGVGILTLGGLVILADVAPLRRLRVDPNRGTDLLPLINGESLALGALALAIAIAAFVIDRWSPTRPFSRGNRSAVVAAAATAGGLIVYLGSIAIVDAFQTRVGSLWDSGELGTQAQVALSITWVIVGAGAFALGLVRGSGLVRAFGLGLLGLATVKVFLFDLASLDVAYRVLSFIGLGGVLLASSFVAARYRGPRRGSRTA